MTPKLLMPALLAMLAASAGANAATEKYTAIFGGRNVGHMVADTQGDVTTINLDIKNNGRGPTIAETLKLDAHGLPAEWKISGNTTFGSKIAEQFSVAGKQARWSDATGPGSARLKEPSVYVAQGSSAWALGVYARALLRSPNHELPALPGGRLRLDAGEALSVNGTGGPVAVTAYALSGIDLTPAMLLLDASGKLFSFLTPDFIIVREGYENEEVRLRALAAKWSTDRFVGIEKEVAHRFDAPVRIRNVRLFDPTTRALTDAVSVVVHGHEIAAVEPLDSPATPGEVSIDGAGGTLVPGMYEMHMHLSQDVALLNVAAGVTSVRDMGNDNAVLDQLIARIQSGAIGGPRVIRSGFVEARSNFSANNGFVVDSEAKAIDAVRWYAARGYWQIKIYNSMNPAWVPAIIKEAHRLGMRVAGHVPAFSNADAMMAAGYDEMTHINQFMLGWVLAPTEDTRTLLRITALKRLQNLDLNSDKVQHTIGMLIDRKLAIDPTLGIHEMLTLGRDGQTPPGAVDYIDHLPVAAQRDARKAMADVSAPGDDAAYRAAFDKIIATVRILHDRGAFIVPGTDTGGSFTYHRELELLVKAGMTPGEVLSRATLDMARYVGQDQRLGSIARGKLADFFLIPGDPTRDIKAIKTISMVVKDGAVYFPSEIYPHFGIQPFIAAPKMTLP